jgi:hypothetical protein
MPESRRELKRSKPVNITISPELRARLEALPQGGRQRACPLDAEKQAALIEFWPKKHHHALAFELGVSHTTAIHWYRILTGAVTQNVTPSGRSR